jgi:hypothetical protein
MGDLKQLSCTLQNPLSIRNGPRFQELAAETRRESS